jgi:hypothetical protein
MGLTILAIIAVTINFFEAFTIDENSMKQALPLLGTSSKECLSSRWVV